MESCCIATRVSQAKSTCVSPMGQIWATGKTELTEVLFGSVCPRSCPRGLTGPWTLAERY